MGWFVLGGDDDGDGEGERKLYRLELTSCCLNTSDNSLPLL